MQRKILLPLALLCLCAARAEDTPEEPQKTAGPRTLALLVRTQVQLTERAAQGTQNDRLREFATRANTEYRAFASALEQLAPDKRGGPAAPRPEGKASKALEKLQSLEAGGEKAQGRALKLYAKVQSRLLLQVRSGLNTTENAAYRSLLEKELPVLENQLEALKALRAKRMK